MNNLWFFFLLLLLLLQYMNVSTRTSYIWIRLAVGGWHRHWGENRSDMKHLQCACGRTNKHLGNKLCAADKILKHSTNLDWIESLVAFSGASARSISRSAVRCSLFIVVVVTVVVDVLHHRRLSFWNNKKNTIRFELGATNGCCGAPGRNRFLAAKANQFPFWAWIFIFLLDSGRVDIATPLRNSLLCLCMEVAAPTHYPRPMETNKLMNKKNRNENSRMGEIYKFYFVYPRIAYVQWFIANVQRRNNILEKFSANDSNWILIWGRAAISDVMHATDASDRAHSHQNLSVFVTRCVFSGDFFSVCGSAGSSHATTFSIYVCERRMQK